MGERPPEAPLTKVNQSLGPLRILSFFLHYGPYPGFSQGNALLLPLQKHCPYLYPQPFVSESSEDGVSKLLKPWSEGAPAPAHLLPPHLPEEGQLPLGSFCLLGLPLPLEL